MSIRDRLVAEYGFAGSAADTSGCGRHGVVHGATLTADRFGRPDHAYRFDGIDDFIEIAPPPAFSSDGVSVSAWVCYEPRVFRGWTNCIVSQDNGDDEDQSRRVFQLSTDSGHIVWHRMEGARDPICRRHVRPGAWTHVVAVHDRGVNRMYVDGVLHDTVQHRLWTHHAQPVHIGRKGTPETDFYFLGAIDDVRVHDRALSEEEIRELLHDGDWVVPPPDDLPIEGDPLSGRWGRNGVVFLDMDYDRDHRVKGQIMAGRPSNMAPIIVGTFDRTTASLRLEGEARDPDNGGPVAWVIEGMLDGGEITVSARFNDYSGNFIFTRNGMLRRVVEGDLPTLFEHQRDPEATAMAAFPARDWDAFLSHWQRNILGNQANIARTILVNDQVAGYVCSWEQDGRRLVGYWVGREYWGRGVARSALDEFLSTHDRHRPIHAYVALSNLRSIRVLEKCGFQRVGEPEVGPDGVAEVFFQFDGPA